jgi:NOL1/NOP2/fmu family ribosome biogenesis protein
MTTKATKVGFHLAEIQRKIIELEHQGGVLTKKDQQKLRKLRQTELKLRQSYDIDLED